MIEGTEDLLFAVLRSDGIGFIDVRPHRVGGAPSFADQGIFDIAVRNWPDLFGRVRLSPAVIGLERSVSAEERAKLRKAGINVPTQGADGAVYMPFFPRTSGKSRSSVQAVQAHLSPRTGPMRAWEKLGEKSPERVLAMIPEERRLGLTQIELHVGETSEGLVEFTATNLHGGPLVLGAGDPPKT
jgi:hypothetical protein